MNTDLITWIRSQLETASYRKKVLLLVCTIGLIRVLIAFVFDFLTPQTSLGEFFIDFSLLGIFVGLGLFALYKKDFHEPSFWAGFIFVLLICYNFLMFGGPAGVSRFNYFASIYAIILVYEGKHKYILLAIQFSIIVIITILLYNGNPWALSLATLPGERIFSLSDFILSISILSILTLFLKQITWREFARFQTTSQRLIDSIKITRSLNDKLSAKEGELVELSNKLESEVSKQTARIQLQSEAIRHYITYNREALNEPLSRLLKVSRNLPPDHKLLKLIALSTEELNAVVAQINRDIEPENIK